MAMERGGLPNGWLVHQLWAQGGRRRTYGHPGSISHTGHEPCCNAGHAAMRATWHCLHAAPCRHATSQVFEGRDGAKAPGFEAFHASSAHTSPLL